MKEINELIKFLDTFITWFERPPFFWNDKARETLKEIKVIIENDKYSLVRILRENKIPLIHLSEIKDEIESRGFIREFLKKSSSTRNPNDNRTS